MPMSKLVKLLAKHEGLRLKPYKCSAGKLTIGYGRNLDDVGISVETAQQMLLEDITAARKEALRFSWYPALDDVRQDVIVNMIFNLGITRFSKFRNTIHFLSLGMYEDAAEEMILSRWADQVGNRAVELSEMMRAGDYL